MAKKSLNFKNQFREAVSYVAEIRNYIYFAIAVFVLSALLGFFFADSFTFLNEILMEISSMVEGLGPAELVFFILQNNLQSAFFAFFFGFFLGIFPVFNAFSNGLILGFVFNRVYQIAGVSEFWRILPHGVFELPAIFIALGLGIRFGGVWFAKNKNKEIKERFYKSINVFLMIIVPLLTIAAAIEGLLIAFLR